jgi:hypothetical protein
MSAIEQTIMKICIWNPAVTTEELVTTLVGSNVAMLSEKRGVDDMIVGVDMAIMEISDGFLDCDYDTEEDNYARTGKVISTLEGVRRYFELVLDYMESQK